MRKKIMEHFGNMTSKLPCRSQEEGKATRHKWSNPNSRASSTEERRNPHEGERASKLKPETSIRQRTSSEDNRRVIGQLLGPGRGIDHLFAGIMGEGFTKNDVEMAKMQTDSQNGPQNRVVFNISGKHYETYDATLDKFPDSLLALPHRNVFYDPLNKEYFFDRNRKAFSAILTYCQTGVLIKPPTLDDRIFSAELRFFGFEDESDMHVAPGPEQPQRILPKNKHQRKIWELFEYPDTSTYARVVAIFSVFVIILSITMFCVETLPNFKETYYQINKDANGTVISKTDKGERLKREYASVFNGVEMFCIVWFTLEYCVRLLSCPEKFKFLYQPLNVIDLVAIMPFYITLALNSVDTNVGSLSILRILRLVRVFRIFKLSRYSRGLKILGYTFKASLQELGLLAFFLLVGIVLFSSAAYYCEESVKDTKFKSIPHTFWWAIVTMTTVGYGDMAPETLGGKLVGSFCVLLGVLAIAFPVPVIVNNFTYYYTLEQSCPEPLDDEYTCAPLGDLKRSSLASIEESQLPTIVIDKVNGKTSGKTSEVNSNDEKMPLNPQVESHV
ncbi:shaker-related potassium channel tsha2-like isoform X2 [Rhopilema esculentum]|uniref:shaker-related potassium channel tsha2-like isoform X2 n=1 Tax=Rhopilema esculentum TaxID=499914 RepID=UPI0031D225D2